MIRVANVKPLTDFQRNAKSHISKLRRSGDAVLLTVKGEGAVVVQDAAAYERLLRRASHAEWIESLREGAMLARKGKGKPALRTLDGLARKHGLLPGSAL